jgi:hypothetical protein
MLLVLASAVFLGSDSLGTRDHILVSQIWGCPFRRLLRLAGSRWRYSTPPPHGYGRVWVWVLCYDRQSVGQPVLVESTHPGLTTRYFFRSEYGIRLTRSLFCGTPSLTRGRVCLLYVPLALASAVFFGPSPLGLGDRILLSQIWVTVEVFDPPPHGYGRVFCVFL